ncbi:sulfatase [Sunxiuqinia elliptica]|uniref:Iduronate 2-sulfatase n=1 Tax=Sunxiuqinia elliptica TaxID=655355 RepID=A0A4R6H5L3_9BACT|nr:sulfatase [Sunxiuqinia elliptica]TDO03440.1 iduronate 2-sulfatase [Sunxiuqinia elliptica]TDO59636.1 iduronate 2-sulfatase [Sunxiuqinia elliptica]
MRILMTYNDTNCSTRSPMHRLKHIFAEVVLICTPFVLHGQEKPNILFIAIDDLRPELACYGASPIKSPNIDKLASEGIVFKHAYCQQALCGPSRVSLMTGVHPDRLGIYGMSSQNPIEWRDTRKDIISLPEQFRKHGYRAVGFGKIYDNRLGIDRQHSWDSFTEGWKSQFASPANREIVNKIRTARQKNLPEPQRKPAWECYNISDEAYTDGSNTSLAIEFIADYKDSNPFFLAVGFNKPHLPFVAPKKYWDLYNSNEIQLPEVENTPDGITQYTLSPYKEIFDYEVKNPVSDAEALTLRHGYYACISYVDAMIGQLIESIEQQGMLDNTIIVIWGDHGFKLGDFGEWAKATNLEVDARVPLIFRFPKGYGVGVKSNAMVELVDIMPTLLEAAGIEVPMETEGRSLMPIIEGKRENVREFALTQYPRKGNVMGYSLRTTGWRYTEWIDQETGEIKDAELYRLENTVSEKENIANKKRGKVRKFSEVLHRYLRTALKW